MLRDIDYAAVAVERAIHEKFGHCEQLADLRITAHDQIIVIEQGDLRAQGTRDRLQGIVRDAKTYAELWQQLAPRSIPK